MDSDTAKKRILAAAKKRIANMDQTTTVYVGAMTDRPPTPEALEAAINLRKRVDLILVSIALRTDLSAAERERCICEAKEREYSLALDDFAAASVKRGYDMAIEQARLANRVQTYNWGNVIADWIDASRPDDVKSK